MGLRPARPEIFLSFEGTTWRFTTKTGAHPDRHKVVMRMKIEGASMAQVVTRVARKAIVCVCVAVFVDNRGGSKG